MTLGEGFHSNDSCANVRNCSSRSLCVQLLPIENFSWECMSKYLKSTFSGDFIVFDVMTDDQCRQSDRGGYYICTPANRLLQWRRPFFNKPFLWNFWSPHLERNITVIQTSIRLLRLPQQRIARDLNWINEFSWMHVTHKYHNYWPKGAVIIYGRGGAKILVQANGRGAKF